MAVRGLTQLYIQFLDIYLKYYLPKLLGSHLFRQGTSVRIHDLIKRFSGFQALSNLIGLRSKEEDENLLEITSMISHKKPK